MSTFEKIYNIVSKIPRGHVMTYGQIAEMIGTTPRIVGFAMRVNKNTDKIPCHRVVGKNGKLIGYTYGGIQMKKKILEQEGIKFADEQTIYFSKSLYGQT